MKIELNDIILYALTTLKHIGRATAEENIKLMSYRSGQVIRHLAKSLTQIQK